MVEDIDDYNRVHQKFNLTRPRQRRYNDMAEGYGQPAQNLLFNNSAQENSSSIPAHKSQTVCIAPFYGIFRQEKFIPVRYAPIQLEFEVVNNATDGVTGSTGQSESLVIQDVQIKRDLVGLDHTLHDEYTQYLTTGKSLPIHYIAIIHASHMLTNVKTDVHVSRSLTRLKSVFITMFAKPDARVIDKGACNDSDTPCTLR